MTESKHFNKIAWAIVAMTLVLTILFMNGATLGIQESTHTMGYEDRLFDQSKVHTIDIDMEDWDEFIANATTEEYYEANLVIDGEDYNNVAIRGKGNTSLSSVAAMDSDRYSFKIEFDQYDSGKTYHGLDKLTLNNLIQDSTMMKDYLCYTMMNQFGVDAPLCSYVYITVNGEDWGLYLAVEGVEDAFLERHYGNDYGELYKPDSMSMAAGGGQPMQGAGDGAAGGDIVSTAEGGDAAVVSPAQNGGLQTPPVAPEGTMQEGSESVTPPAMQQGGGMPGGGMGSDDVKLQYIDDDPDSYSNIWNNAKTDCSDADKTRLIESLKKLSNNEDIESVVDVDQVLRYFVVHNFVCNDDSYTGMMVHNYYLHEQDGQLSMIPWDYNLAFGTFGGSNATSTVNTPIDSPVSGGSEDRPMLHWIYENDTYTSMYHQLFSEFLSEVDIETLIDDTYTLIKPYVEKDPTAFYSVDEFEAGVDALCSFCSLRSESVTTQLESGNTTENTQAVDATDLDLSDMGTMNGGGGAMPNMPGAAATLAGDAAASQENTSTAPSGGTDAVGVPPQAESGDAAATTTVEEEANAASAKQAADADASASADAGMAANAPNNATPPDGMQMPGNDNEATTNNGTMTYLGWLELGASVLILLLGLFIAKMYRA